MQTKSDKCFKIITYIFTIIFSLIILFPLSLMVSNSLKDDTQIYETPPKLLPGKAKSVAVTIDYSKIKNKGSEYILDAMEKDSTIAMYSIIYEMNDQGIQEIKMFGNIDGKTVFYTRAHKMRLQAEKGFGVYGQTSINKKTLIMNDRYKKSAELIGYEFNLNGLDKDFYKQGDNNEYNDTIKTILCNKFGIEGDFQNTRLASNSLLLLENFKYYFLMPTYVYGGASSFIKKYSFFGFMFNTLILVVASLLLQVFLCSITGFSLSRLFPKKTSNFLLLFFMGSQMVPFICIMIPQLIMYKNMGFYNNYAGLIVPYLYPYALFIYLYKGFFDQIPGGLLEAARIDGASSTYIYSRVFMPLSKPITSIVILQAFLGSWNDFFWPYLVTRNEKMWTLNVALYNLSSNPDVKQNFTMGLSIVTIIPVIILTIIFSNQIKQSISSTGIKG